MLATDFLSEYDEIIEQLQNFDSSISRIEALKIAIEISKSRFIEGVADNILDSCNHLCNQMLEIEQEISALRLAIKGEE